MKGLGFWLYRSMKERISASSCLTEVWPAGEPSPDLGGFVGGIVIHDDMDIELIRDFCIDLLEEVQELGRPMALVAFADDQP